MSVDGGIFFMSILVIILSNEALSTVIWGNYDMFMKSSYLPLDRESMPDIHQYYVDNLNKTQHVNTTWLPIRRKDLQGWYWLSGEYQGVSLSRTSLYGRDCGVLRVADKTLDDHYCDRQYQKFLCQKQGFLCSSDIKNCFVYSATRYTIFEEKSNWYQARTKCYMQGEQLAALPKAHRPQLFEIIHKMTETFPDIWVGLRKRDYYFTAHQIIAVDAFFWREADRCPCQSKYDCVALERTEDQTFFWKPQNCSDNISFPVCVYGTNTKHGTADPDIGAVTPVMQGTNASGTGTQTIIYKYPFTATLIAVITVLVVLLLGGLALSYRKELLELLELVGLKRQHEKVPEQADATQLNKPEEMNRMCEEPQAQTTELQQLRARNSSLQLTITNAQQILHKAVNDPQSGSFLELLQEVVDEKLHLAKVEEGAANRMAEMGGLPYGTKTGAELVRMQDPGKADVIIPITLELPVQL